MQGAPGPRQRPTRMHGKSSWPTRTGKKRTLGRKIGGMKWNPKWKVHRKKERKKVHTQRKKLLLCFHQQFPIFKVQENYVISQPVKFVKELQVCEWGTQTDLALLILRVTSGKHSNKPTKCLRIAYR